MNNLPNIINNSPIPPTIEILSGFLEIKETASLAPSQNEHDLKATLK